MKISDAERIIKKEIYGGKEFEVIYRKAKTPVSPQYLESLPPEKRAGLGAAPEINQRTYIAEEGILCEQDVPVFLRDGTKIYADIFRPVGEAKVPVILSWSFFGKRPGEGSADYQILGVPPQTVSHMAKFEGPDPAYWCRQGYAIANVDPRGVGRSEGDLKFHGEEPGLDGYDFIEWVAKQHWCNGKVGMSGNSGLAIIQWRIAATNPPHLACIAPWEGTGDFYREALMEGGIPAIGFNDNMLSKLTSLGYLEDYVAMLEKYPFMNEYWEDKIPKYSNITIPAYVVAGWNHFHLRGTIEGFRKIKSTKKWLRTHREFEWPDYYNLKNLADLKMFFDRYLKDIRNGWELTPRVRLEVMDAYDYDYQTDRPEKEFPLKRTEYKKLYLDASKGALSFEPIKTESKVSYDAVESLTNFDIKFTEETEITGFIKLHLWVEADGNDDMDLFVTIKKLDEDGNWLPTLVMGEKHPGSWGKMRVSRRALDEKLSTDYMPVHAHTKDEKLSKGEIVPVDIEIWPTSWIWHEGEQLRIEIAGRYIREEGWFETFSWDINNKGYHIIHTGGKYDSYLQIPVIPPRHKSGKYILR